MSRIHWALLFMVGAVFGLVAHLATAGVSSYALAAAETAHSAISAAEDRVSAGEAELKALLEQKPVLASQPEAQAGEAAFAVLRVRVEGLRKRAQEEVQSLVDANEGSSDKELRSKAEALIRDAEALTLPVPSPSMPVRELLSFIDDFEDHVTSHRQSARDLRALAEAGPPHSDRIASVGARCPQSVAALSSRAQALADRASGAADNAESTLQAATTGAPDKLAVGRRIKAAREALTEIRQGVADLGADLDSLTRSEDVILSDMKSEGGSFFHRYQRIVDGQSTEGEWEVVPPAKYRQHADHLGLAISSKPECTLRSEAVTTPAPPGYAYVGNDRYGHWENRGGQSFWVFYGQYALMRDMLWGAGRYQPVSRGHYQSWRTHQSQRKAYFGPSNEYGTKGTATRTRYANSQYIKRSVSAPSGRPAGNTGGGSSTFRDSKYSSSGSSSRSGGFRSSSYRSSSFRGSGK